MNTLYLMQRRSPTHPAFVIEGIQLPRGQILVAAPQDLRETERAIPPSLLRALDPVDGPPRQLTDAEHDEILARYPS